MKKQKTLSLLSIWIMCILCLFIGFFVAIIACFTWLYNTPKIKEAFTETYFNENKSSFVKSDLLSNTVEITIPSSFFELNEEPFDYQLTEENKENGFISVKKNDDDSATYTIKKNDYNLFIEKLKTETASNIDRLVADGTFTSIKTIEYTDKFETVTITADKEHFENGIDSMAVLNCGLSSYMYSYLILMLKVNVL